MPISFRDSELTAVMEAAAPIPASGGKRPSFRSIRRSGPGLIGRLARDMQRRYLEPPALHGNAFGKYGRR